MRLVYCTSCRHVSLRSRLEKDRCERCGKSARLMRVPYPWQYFAGTAIVVAGAFFIVLPQIGNGFPWASLVESFAARVVWLIVFVGTGLYFSSWGVRVMKEAALRRGAELFPEADA